MPSSFTQQAPYPIYAHSISPSSPPSPSSSFTMLDPDDLKRTSCRPNQQGAATPPPPLIPPQSLYILAGKVRKGHEVHQGASIFTLCVRGGGCCGRDNRGYDSSRGVSPGCFPTFQEDRGGPLYSLYSVLGHLTHWTHSLTSRCKTSGCKLGSKHLQ